MISVQEAEEKILEAAHPLGIEERPLKETLGLFLSEEVRASMSLPAFDHSAMDGYALHSADLENATKEAPVRLNLVGEVAAGSVRSQPISSGQAVSIMTGAAMPPGVDTVVILEEAKRRNGMVVVDHPVSKGRHIRRRGEDVEAGKLVLSKGRKIRPAEIALLASLGVTRVKTFRPPRVAILATGSELIGVNEPLKAGTIRDSNSWVLESHLTLIGVPVLNLGIVPDEESAILQAFRKAGQCDVILSSGGVSVGEHDLVKRVLIKEFDFQTIFWRVRMKPGKPLLFGRLNDKLFFGLPGNPVSCAVCFIRFIAPALKEIMGDPTPSPVTRRALLTHSISIRETEKAHFITAQLDLKCEPPWVTPTSHQGSGMLTSMAEGNALIAVPEGVKELAAGVEVEVIPE